MPDLYVDLAIPVAVDNLFTYIVPGDLHHEVKCGVRVIAPFGNRSVVGIVVAIKRHSNVTRLKSIHDIIDVEPIISEELLNLTKWIAEYYFAPWGEVLKAVLVQGATQAKKRTITLNMLEYEHRMNKDVLSPKQLAVVHELTLRGRMSVAQIQKTLKTKNIYTILSQLAKQNIISITEELPKSRLTAKTEHVVEINAVMKQRWNDRSVTTEAQKFLKRSPRAEDVMREVLITPDAQPVSLTELLKKTHASLSTVKTLARKQFLSINKREVTRSTEFDLYASALGAQNIILNDRQCEAHRRIVEGISTNIFQTFLLYGITGSGKTQVYIEAIRETIAQGKTAIVLVPEIALTPQIVRRFKMHFGEKIAVLHSRMSIGERYDAWRMAHEGKCSVVIGPRSAVFAPLKNIGLIVVDEEQEPSYKQYDQTPRYHARDVAIMRARLTNAAVVLGSATPSFESYANATSGKYMLLELPERVDNATLPLIEIVDMTVERKRKIQQYITERRASAQVLPPNTPVEKRKFEFGSISDLLKEKIEDRLKKKEGIILLQNRRGFATFIECPDCGYVAMCDHCNISLTYHQTKKHLRCHYCGMVKQPPDVCPHCHSSDIAYRGFGTQRVEEELRKLFPSATMIRMDLDTTSSRGAHDRILRKFSDGEVDILLGTQMVAKGLDFSRVTLVGVISADTQMLLPDFRSAERTFQLLTQVAGRAGRSVLSGEVVIQTYQPQHDSLKHVTTHDFKAFYDEEIQYRKELDYPPFSRLVLIEFKGKNEVESMRHASAFVDILKKQHAQFITLGPAAAAIAKLKNMYRWHVVVKSVKEQDPSGHIMHSTVQSAMQTFKKTVLGKSRSVKIVVDVDPVGMM